MRRGRGGGAPPADAAPLSAAALAALLGPGRVVEAYSALTGRRLGTVTLVLPRSTRLRGGDAVHVRGRRVGALLPIASLVFAVREVPGQPDTLPSPSSAAAAWDRRRGAGASRDDRVVDASRTARIRALNDRLRTTGRGGDVVITGGVAALPGPVQAAVMAAVQGCAGFTPHNDPHGEHDCAALEVEGHRVLFTIDCYDVTLGGGPPDPADPAVTRRVLTIMLAEGY
jgi:hypothetical protein